MSAAAGVGVRGSASVGSRAARLTLAAGSSGFEIARLWLRWMRRHGRFVFWVVLAAALVAFPLGDPGKGRLLVVLDNLEQVTSALALALNTNPKVLFLDEPCAGLSPAERQRISQMIAALPRDITLLMIEHDMDVALGLADRVTVLHQGRVILEGSPDEVRADTQVRDVYFGHG